MLMIVGALVVIGSIMGGYLMEGGKVLLLSQPAEFIIIGGVRTRSLLISDSIERRRKLCRSVKELSGCGSQP